METQRIVVTGASGFIGSHVLERLVADGHDVVGLDLQHPRQTVARFVEGDFTRFEHIRPIVEKADAVCHIGGIGDVYLAERDPELAFRVNANGTLVVAQACQEAHVGALIYASTWEVYGKARYEPVDEDHPCAPESPYSISKLAGDLTVQACGSRSEIKTLVLRLGTAYGRNMRETSVIRRFIERGRAGKGLVVFGKGSQFRQFTHTSDIARAFSLAVSRSIGSEVLNIVADEKTTLANLAHLVSKKFGTSVTYQDARKSEPPSILVSSAKAKQLLGWGQLVPFAKGLEELITSDAGQ